MARTNPYNFPTPRKPWLVVGVVLCTTGAAFAQRGPVLPTRQDFPPPSKVNRADENAGIGGPVEVPDLPSQTRPKSEPVEPPVNFEPEVFMPPVPPTDDTDNIAPSRSLKPPALPPRNPQFSNNGAAVTTDYNFGIALSEAMLNDLASTAREQTDSVFDRVLGTPVSGTQRTRATTRIDCRKNNKTGQVDIVLESLTNSTTLGRRPSAMISTEGCHRADLTKPVFFDGKTLTTRRPEGFVKANNLNRGVVTSLTGVPLLGPVANRIAQTQTARSKTAAETETAMILSRRVVPEFNETVDQQLGTANRTLRGSVRSWLEDKRLWPAEMKVNSTDDELRLRARYGSAGAVSIPGRRLFGRNGSVLLHETAANTYLNSLNISGLRITDRQLKRTLAGLSGNTEPAAEVRGENEIAEDLTEPLLYTIVFARQDPVTVRFTGDNIDLALRLTIQAVVGEPIPMQEVRLPIKPRVEADRLIVDFGAPQVAPADGSLPETASQLIQEQIAQLLKPVELPNSREFAIGATKKLTAKASEVGTSNGWLLIAID